MKWGAYIAGDMAERLSAGGALPPLTLAGLSAHYGVSATPVREAVAELTTRGWLHRQSNGRLVPGPRAGQSAGTGSTVAAPVHRTLLEEPLIDLIVRASLAPEAVFLREQVLAERLHTSRTVLRQILSRLSGADLIEHVPRRGWRVQPVREEDVQAYLEVRTSLEAMALDRAYPRLEEASIRTMLHGNPPDQEAGAARLDNRLHAYLVERSGNRYLVQFFQQPVARYFAALFDHAAPEAHVVADMAEQHRHILQALLDRDLPRAQSALREHILAQGTVLHGLLNRPGTHGETG